MRSAPLPLSDRNAFLLQQGQISLHHAARQGNVKVIELLIDAGAIVDARDTVRAASLSVLFSLLGLTLSPSPVKRRHATPFLFAAFHGNVDAMELLTKHGADIRVLALISLRSLSRPILSSHFLRLQAVDAVFLSVARFLFALLCPLADLPWQYNHNALILATYQGEIKSLLWNIEHGSNVNQLNHVSFRRLCEPPLPARFSLPPQDGNSGAHWAIYNGRMDVLEILIACGANIELLNSVPDLPLTPSILSCRFCLC